MFSLNGRARIHTQPARRKRSRTIATAAAFSRTRVIRFEKANTPNAVDDLEILARVLPVFDSFAGESRAAVDAKCAVVCDAVLNVFPDFLVTVSRIIMKFVYLQLSTLSRIKAVA